MRYNGKFFVPSIADILFLTLFLILSLSTGTKLLIDCDTGYHIRTGEFILKTLSVPKHDIFSFFTPPLPWIAFEWLSEVIMAVIHKTFGLTGIVIFFSFLISSVYYVLFKFMRKQKGNIIIAVFIVVLVITSSALHWLARPHIFSLLLMVIWYYLLDVYQYDGKNYLYMLPPLMLLWVNLHGAFILGFILMGIYFFGNLLKYSIQQGEERERYKQKTKFFGVTTTICLLVSLINPYGYNILLHPFNVVSSKFIVDYISEFLSPNFHNLPMMPFEILLLFLILIFAVSKNRLNFIELVLIILFTNMALYSVRHIPLFSIVTAPILVRQAELVLNQHNGRFIDFLQKKSNNIAEVDMSARGYLWIVVPVILAVIVVTSMKIEYRFDEKIKPIAAAEFLKNEHIKGNMYNEYEFGDYIIYSLYPKYKVFIDGRADMYGTDKMKEYFKVEELKSGWQKILEKYNIKWIIFNADSIFSKFLLEKNEWRLIYSDKVANIFVKNIPENQYLINKYSNVKPIIVEDKDNESI